MPDDLCDWLDEFGMDDATAAHTHLTAEVEGDDEFTPVPHGHIVGSADWIDLAAASLRHNGFCVLKSRYGIEPKTLFHI